MTGKRGLILLFATAGFTFASWAVRLPSLKANAALSKGELGLVLLAMAGSAVLAMVSAPRLFQKWSTVKVAVTAALVLAGATVPTTTAASAVALATTLIVLGGAFGLVDVALNSAAVEFLGPDDRGGISGFHAANSLGSLAGACVGAALATRMTLTEYALVCAAVATLAVLAAAGDVHRLPLGPLPASQPDRPSIMPARSPTGAAWLTGLLALLAAYAQGAMDHWVPLHITTSLEGSPAQGAVAYGVAAGSIGLGRLLGGFVVRRTSEPVVMVAGSAAASVAMLVVAAAPNYPIALAGLAVTGLGLANLFPLALARAGRAAGPHGIARSATLGYTGLLLAPPSIGLLAQLANLRVGISLVTLALTLAGVIAHRHSRSVSPTDTALRPSGTASTRRSS